MFKRVKTKSFIFLVLIALLASSVGVGLAQDETVTIRFLHKWPDPEPMEYFEWVIDEFEAENPNIEVDMEAVADEPYKDKIRVVMASGDVPDVFFSWAGEFSWKFARAGRALPLDDYFYGTEWEDQILSGALGPYMWDGTLYGIPMRVNAKYIVYNKSHFDELGLEIPTTWDEFLTVCEALQEDGKVPIAFGNEFPWASSHWIGDLNGKLVPPDVRQADYLLTADPADLFQHPGYVEALRRFQELGEEGYFNEGANALQHSLARASFVAGRASMMYVEVVEFTMIAEDMGNDAFGFFPLPSNPDDAGDPDLLTGAPDGFMVSADTEHPDEAIAFLKFLTRPEVGARYVADIGMPSASIGAVNEDTAIPVLVEGIERMDEASGMALWLDTDLDIRIVEVYLPGQQAVLNGTESPESVMEMVREAALEVQAEMAEE
jgi:raffinose/stachyose/melibiose transport system substrate-binding protein